MEKAELGDVKRKILVVDDSEMNRSLLCDMLAGDYEILEAGNGLEASAILQGREQEIALMLLDIVMPEMDGFSMLAAMNKNGWIKSVPVIIISSETVPSYVDRAYELGALDYISRPFDERIVQRRVSNTLTLFAKQKELENIVVEQIQKRESDNALMIEILSNIVESRNGESGVHVVQVRILTELILKKLLEKTDRYFINKKDIPLICNAASLHDIGKIAIPAEILNKPGKLTKEEFEIMKTHSAEGAKLLKEMPMRENEPLIKYGYEICRWHHERYDGRGYPDGLKGDEIPITAQVVALADVYNALRQKRVYKPGYSHEKAMDMILGGECGAFNPILLQCMAELSDTMQKEMEVCSEKTATKIEVMKTIESRFEKGDIGLSDRTIQLLEKERMKYRFFANISHEIHFEYTKVPEMLILSEWSADYLELPEVIMNPKENEFGTEIFQEKDFARLLTELEDTEREDDIFVGDYLLTIKGRKRWNRVIARSIWSEAEPREFVGVLGKIADVQNETEKINNLKSVIEKDSLTGLLNHRAARERIGRILAQEEDLRYILIVFDLDDFKQANDQRGHLFGDEVLKFVSSTLMEGTRRTDILSRIGGDEFLLFMPYVNEKDLLVERVFNMLDTDLNGFHISVSMGIAFAKDCDREYDTLFHMADVALYWAKKAGKHAYHYYDKADGTMDTLNSALSLTMDDEE